MAGSAGMVEAVDSKATKFESGYRPPCAFKGPAGISAEAAHDESGSIPTSREVMRFMLDTVVLGRADLAPVRTQPVARHGRGRAATGPARTCPW